MTGRARVAKKPISLQKTITIRISDKTDAATIGFNLIPLSVMVFLPLPAKVPGRAKTTILVYSEPLVYSRRVRVATPLPY